MSAMIAADAVLLLHAIFIMFEVFGAARRCSDAGRG